MMMLSFSSLQSISIFPINPKISLCTFSIKNNLSNEWEIFKEPVLVRLFFFRQLAVLVTQGPLMAEEGF